MDHRFVHLEIPADDLDRAREFYSQLFNWELSTTPGFDDYWMFDSSGGRQEQGGAVMKRQYPDQTPVVYFNVESVDDTMARVKDLGGEILMPKTPVPAMGWLAQFRDPEGNVLAVWQSDTSAA